MNIRIEYRTFSGQRRGSHRIYVLLLECVLCLFTIGERNLFLTM